MSKLIFRNTYGEERVIAECQTLDDVYKEINAFVLVCNKSKPADKWFNIYYTRVWEQDGRTKIDVGSHSEFFYVDPPIKEQVRK